MWNLREFTYTYTRFRESGLTVRDFCQNESINEAKFYYWQKKLKEQNLPENSPSGFVPLVLHPSSSLAQVRCSQRTPTVSAASSCEIIYPNGVMLRLPVSIDLRFLTSLLSLSE